MSLSKAAWSASDSSIYSSAEISLPSPSTISRLKSLNTHTKEGRKRFNGVSASRPCAAAGLPVPVAERVVESPPPETLMTLPRLDTKDKDVMLSSSIAPPPLKTRVEQRRADNAKIVVSCCKSLSGAPRPSLSSSKRSSSSPSAAVARRGVVEASQMPFVYDATVCPTVDTRLPPGLVAEPARFDMLPPPN